MKHTLFSLILLLSFSLMSNAQNINTLTKADKKAGWELLFNGKNMNGWKAFQGKEISGWKVIVGVLNNSGIGSDHGGDIKSWAGTIHHWLTIIRPGGV